MEVLWKGRAAKISDNLANAVRVQLWKWMPGNHIKLSIQTTSPSLNEKACNRCVEFELQTAVRVAFDAWQCMGVCIFPIFRHLTLAAGSTTVTQHPPPSAVTANLGVNLTACTRKALAAQ